MMSFHTLRRDVIGPIFFGLRSLSQNRENVRFTFQPTNGETTHYLKEKSRMNFLPQSELGELDDCASQPRLSINVIDKKNISYLRKD